MSLDSLLVGMKRSRREGLGPRSHHVQYQLSQCIQSKEAGIFISCAQLRHDLQLLYLEGENQRNGRSIDNKDLREGANLRIVQVRTPFSASAPRKLLQSRMCTRGTFSMYLGRNHHGGWQPLTMPRTCPEVAPAPDSQATAPLQIWGAAAYL